MNEAFLLLGGNVGDREENLRSARQEIEHSCGKIVKSSSLYETAAWGKEDQQSFLNQVIQIRTAFSAALLLKSVLEIELSAGRRREVKYGPRTIDIDILFFNNEVIDSHGLKVPHPQMPYRRFVLEPLSELVPDMVHPVLHKTVSRLLAECTDPLEVNKFC